MWKRSRYGREADEEEEDCPYLRFKTFDDVVVGKLLLYPAKKLYNFSLILANLDLEVSGSIFSKQ